MVDIHLRCQLGPAPTLGSKVGIAGQRVGPFHHIQGLIVRPCARRSGVALIASGLQAQLWPQPAVARPDSLWRGRARVVVGTGGSGVPMSIGVGSWVLPQIPCCRRCATWHTERAARSYGRAGFGLPLGCMVANYKLGANRMRTCRSAVGCTTPFSFRSRINPGYDIKIFKLSWQTGNSPANRTGRHDSAETSGPENAINLSENGP